MNGITGGVRLAPHARFGGTAKGATQASPYRRQLIGKVHVAKKALSLVDDDYRQILLNVTGHASSADCSDAQLVALLKHFEARGFKPQKGKGPRPADHPGAGKARALWISLAQLGAIDNPSEQALEALARRQLKCDRLQWADQALVYRLIEALKAIAERHGWRQSLDGIPSANAVIVLKRRLIDAQIVKLRKADWVGADWDACRAAREFGGVEVKSFAGADLAELDQIAQALGGAIADAKAAEALK